MRWSGRTRPATRKLGQDSPSRTGRFGPGGRDCARAATTVLVAALSAVVVLLGGCVAAFDESSFRRPDGGDADISPDSDVDAGPDADADVEPDADVEVPDDTADDDGADDGGGCIPEECDDDNACNGQEVCTIDGECVGGRPPDDGTACTTAAGVDGFCYEERCRPVTCGNGVTNSGEDCDDGNLVDGDGCESDCT
ncbi:MAG: hypothetical protein JXB32_23640, partial [Deltaproteobacteria bacterium]|nr:hypothetical protein [Deltaproteobacteria bacterium]